MIFLTIHVERAAKLRYLGIQCRKLKERFLGSRFFTAERKSAPKCFVILSTALKNCRSAPSDEWGKPLQTAAPNPADRLKNGWLHF